MNRRRERIRVVHVVHRLSVDGGVQVVIRRLISALDPEQFDVHVVTARPRAARDELDSLPAVVHPLNHESRYRWRARLPLALAAARAIASTRPEVVHLHSGTAWLGIVARLRLPSVPFVLEVHDAPGSGRHSRWTDVFEGCMVRCLSMHVVCHSSSVAEDVRRRWRVPSNRIDQFPLSVDTAQVRAATAGEREEWRTGHGLRAATIVMIAVGRIVPSKRFDRAVEVLHRARAAGRDVALVLVGAGPLEDELERHIGSRQLERHVRRLSNLDDRRLVAALGASDLLLSTSDYEGFGLTVIEGMAAGLPVVATAVGGVNDVVVQGVSGLLVPTDRPEHDVLAGLVDAVELLADDSAERARMSAAGRERAVREYGVDAMGRRFGRMYSQLAAARQRRDRSVVS